MQLNCYTDIGFTSQTCTQKFKLIQDALAKKLLTLNSYVFRIVTVLTYCFQYTHTIRPPSHMESPFIVVILENSTNSLVIFGKIIVNTNTLEPASQTHPQLLVGEGGIEIKF